MTFNDPKFWLDLLQWAIVLAVAGTTWLRKPGQAAIDGLASLRKHVDEQHQDIHTTVAVLRERMEHMPTDEELAQLAGAVRAMSDSQERISLQLSRIETYLLNNK